MQKETEDRPSNRARGIDLDGEAGGNTANSSSSSSSSSSHAKLNFKPMVSTSTVLNDTDRITIAGSSFIYRAAASIRRTSDFVYVEKAPSANDAQDVNLFKMLFEKYNLDPNLHSCKGNKATFL